MLNRFVIKRTTTKIFLMNTVLVLLFLGVLYVGVISHVKENIISNIYNTNDNYGKLIASDIEYQLDRLVKTMEFLSEMKEVKSFEYESLDKIFQSVIDKDSDIDQIHIVDKLGNQIYKTSFKDTIGDRSDRAYFQKAIAGEAYISDVIISRSTNKPISVVAVPIYNNSQVIGVLSASINLNSISEKLESLSFGDESYGFIVDNYGRIIAHPREDYVQSLMNVSYLDPVKRVMNREVGTGVYTFAKVKKLVSYRPIRNADWGILVQMPEKIAFSDIEKITLRIKYSFLIFFIALLIFQEVVLKKYINPVEEIVEKIRFIKRSKGKISFDKKAEGELGEIQNAIEEMSSEIFQSYRELDTKVSQRTKELNKSNKILSKKLSELEDAYNELEKANKKIEKMNVIESSSRLAKQIAHNLNTPLGSILTTVTFMVRNLKEGIKNNKCSSEKYLSMAEIIEESIKNVISQMEEFKSIISFERLPEEKVEVDIISELKFCENSLRMKYGLGTDKDMLIKIENDENVTILSYPNIFRYIFTQLISNSIEHGKYDKETISIDIRIYLKDNRLHLHYSDDGKGMKKENVINIFDPYFKELMSKDSIGIGMSMVFNLIVNILEGTIECESELEQGMKCQIIIPMN